MTAPASNINIKAGDDFATMSFQDPWDMKQNTDLSWHVWSIDAPPNGLNGVSFNVANAALKSSDLFHAVSTNANPILELLQTSNGFSAKLGRTGDNFPISTAKYQRLSVRMCLSGPGLNSPTASPSNTASAAFLLWTPNEAGQPGLTQAGAMFTVSGCAIYAYDLTNLPIASGTPWTSIPSVQWLRFDPTHVAGVTIDVDWVRLTSPGANQTINWAGGGTGDIYLDDDGTASNGTLGILADRNGAAQGRPSGYAFDPSGLSPGTYRVLVCPAGTATPATPACKYSAGSYIVNGIPTIDVTAPSPEGSTDDFATVQLNNAWDFDTLNDIDFKQNIAALSIDPAFPSQRPDGTDLGNIRVLRGTPSSSNPGDAYFYTLFFAGTGRGVTTKIDADRYRVLTVEAGLPGPRDINNGSIARVVWKSTAESAENVSQDILINHRTGANILDTISVDMKHLLRETGPGLGVSGWTGQIENFRFDPHEFTPITDFWVRRIKLAAFETIGSTNTYTIRWSAADTFDTSNTTGLKVSAAYQAEAAGTGLPSGTITNILGCQNITASTGQCTWNTASVAATTYFVILTVTDGVNTNTAYSKYPVIVDQTAMPKPRLVLDRSQLNFGGTNNGAVRTPPQPLRLSIVGPGSSSTHWTASVQGSASNLFTVSPTFGTGPALLTVSINSTPIDNGVVGPLGTVVVASAEADNSTQATTVFLEMKATTGAPFGGFDTPADSAVLQGSVAVTGWALDDIGISKVDILRDAHPNDPAGAVVAGKVFIATATIVDGARG
ncbi:MAG TPA: hypothetical protein VM165_14130, partial [Planctomycetaceae bacterium]|nr:hypothetical protein [Planctomycetaceae bacterium]